MIEAFNQFRAEITESSQTRSLLPKVDILSIEKKNYQFELPQNDSNKKRDSVDVFTITFTKEEKEGYAILSPDERVGRIYVYTDFGQLNDTIENKALASFINNISSICKLDLYSYYQGKSHNIKTRSNERRLMIPNLIDLAWSDGMPFNAKCPTGCNPNIHGGHTSAGAGTIAVAQLLIYYRKYIFGYREPYYVSNSQLTKAFSNENPEFNYDLLASYPQITNDSPIAVKNEIADFIFTIAELFPASYDCGTIGHQTTTDIKNVNNVFKHFTGWDFGKGLEHIKVSSILNIDNEKFVYSLALKNPILVKGIFQYGALTQTWLYTGVKYIERDYNVSNITEFYINWGQGESSNGWYAYAHNNDYLPFDFVFIDTWGGGGAIQ